MYSLVLSSLQYAKNQVGNSFKVILSESILNTPEEKLKLKVAVAVEKFEEIQKWIHQNDVIHRLCREALELIKGDK